MTTQNYWKQKTSAHLHDSPNKILNIIGHEAAAKSFESIYDLATEEQFRKDADFAASAADRIPFPKSSWCQSSYDIVKNPLRHPLSAEPIRFDLKQSTNRQAEEDAHRTIPILSNAENDEDADRLAFLALWRFWQNWASDRNQQLAYYPAETRLPDHTIWNHLSITSAMQGCYGGSKADWDAHLKRTTKELPDQPAMLLFSIGPVQDFIAAARNTRDLWSGSYLLSYLCASALAKIARDFGPDHVIFPNLKGQPLIDFMLREDWKRCGSSADSNYWEAFDYSTKEGKDAILTPSLPNRFLALLPSQMTRHSEWESTQAYAKHLASHIRKTLKEIADSVAEALKDLPQKTFNHKRFDQQVDAMLELHWQITPLTQSIPQIKAYGAKLPKNSEKEFEPTAGFDAVLNMVQKMPSDHRDKRYFKDGDTAKGELKQTAGAWPVYYALTGWQLDGVKALRPFTANNGGTWEKGRSENKDSLTGKEEACLIAPDDQVACQKLVKDCIQQAPQNSLKPNEFLGAATVIKRFWHLTYLCADREFTTKDFCMPNTRSIAMHDPFADSAEQDIELLEGTEKYYAVLALDGDEMGKWVSGAKLPFMKNLLSSEGVEYFKQHDSSGFLDKRRPLAPSFHLQFSEMLGNFSLHCARRVVEHYDGRLIYAGGDDVLAMLPADTALDCAATLRAAFRGDSKLHSDCPESFQSSPEGTIRLQPDAARKRYRNSCPSNEDPLVSDPHNFAALVPGQATDVSCGIAIGHIKAPLQDMVKAAQAAEKRAKNQLQRGACAITLFKRSGEIREWGFKWQSSGAATAPVLPLLKLLLAETAAGKISKRFSYSLSARLEPFSPQRHFQSDAKATIDPAFAANVNAIVQHEIEYCLGQHHNGSNDEKKRISELFQVYWNALDSETDRQLGEDAAAKITDLLGLLATLAWLNKH
jgi:CRISPR-associated protein Cas10/Cmr2 subtype III-B